MSWDTITPARGSAGGPDVIKVGCWESGQFVVQFGEGVLKTLKWKLAAKLSMQLGRVEHSGKLRIAVATNGESFALGAVKGGGAIKTKHPAMVGTPFKLTIVAHEIKDGAVYLTLPEIAPAQAPAVSRPGGAPIAPRAAPPPSTGLPAAVATAKTALERAGKTVNGSSNAWYIGRGSERLSDTALIRAAQRIGA